MRDAVGHDEHVTLAQLVGGAAVDEVRPQLAGGHLAGGVQRAAGDDLGPSPDHPHDVDDAGVVLDRAGRGAPARVDLVPTCVDQQAA